MDNIIDIDFNEGTLLVTTAPDCKVPFENWCVYDERFECWRAEASEYANIIKYLYSNKIPYNDIARKYQKVEFRFHETRDARPYQAEAMEAWKSSGRRGIIVLPTGTGKTFVAEMAIESAGRSTLIVVPTIDLMTQWANRLERTFGRHIAMFGGGAHEFGDITVSTYESALLTIDAHGNEFGLLVVDECHHLPGETYRHIAKASIAPFRLGLSATPERDDLPEGALTELLGEICYRKDIDEMGGEVLASYRTERICVDLSDEEFAEYHANREIYIDFIRRNGIQMSSKDGWMKFLIAVSRRPDGRDALKAFFAQKRIALSGRAKLDMLWTLLRRHANGRIIVFTADNKTAYEIGERFRLPVLTHHTKSGERKEFLDAFRRGEYPCIVTSRVLNEGVDVPEADVGIVISGTGSIREHVQRLGRILRPAAGKSAVLYELVSLGTSEYSISDRRRQHRAYERPDC